jgi:hypothetical protein
MYASAGLQSRMQCRQWREWHGGGAALLLQARWLGRRREFDQVRNRETVFLLSISPEACGKLTCHLPRQAEDNPSSGNSKGPISMVIQRRRLSAVKQRLRVGRGRRYGADRRRGREQQQQRGGGGRALGKLLRHLPRRADGGAVESGSKMVSFCAV